MALSVALLTARSQGKGRKLRQAAPQMRTGQWTSPSGHMLVPARLSPTRHTVPGTLERGNQLKGVERDPVVQVHGIKYVFAHTCVHTHSIE